ncbi:MAG: RimK family protein [Acidobacteriota bacterium]|nr:RimK family protein [Acidobacteriota bacterium]
MPTLVVVERAEDWPIDLPGVEVVNARRYLTDPAHAGGRGVKVFNLCRRYGYQSLGYYVSLLGQARGHRPLPSVATLQDLRNRSLVRVMSEDLAEEVQRSLSPIAGRDFTLSVYFGRNLAKRHQRLASRLFNLFPAPLLRAEFTRRRKSWEMRSLRVIPAREIPDRHHDFVVTAAREHFARRRAAQGSRPLPARWDLAILVNPEEAEPPSDERGLKRLVRAAHKVGFDVEILGPGDYGRIAEFDALLLRETTSVEHHTYRFARRAAAEGLVVIDDPESILRCTNKVYLAEALERARVPIPATRIVDRDTLDVLAREMVYPCILKQPDSCASRGVVRVDDEAGFLAAARRFFQDSELLIAQEFLPTDYDWRIGVLEGRPLFAARYKMVPGHWQIISRDAAGAVVRYGGTDAVALEDVPARVVELALAAAAVVGDGLYGVDLKQRGEECWVIEVNDNPNLDADCEDRILGEALYLRLMQVMLDRLERRKALPGGR